MLHTLDLLNCSKFDLPWKVKLLFLDYNHFHNILRLFDVLPNISFTASETMGDYYGIYELLQELPNDLRLRKIRKLRNIRKVSKLHRMIAQCPVPLPK